MEVVRRRTLNQNVVKSKPPLTDVPEGAPSVVVITDSIFEANNPSVPNYQWFGRAAMKSLPDDTWVCIYANSSSHVNTTYSVLHIRFSDDYGETWSNRNRYIDGSAVVGFPMHPPGAGPGDATGAGEPWLILCPNGDLICTMWDVQYGIAHKGNYSSRSTDGGKTWSSPVKTVFRGVTGNEDAMFMTDDDFVVDNTIYAGVRYHTNTPHADQSESLLFKSTDNASSWDYISTLNDHNVNPQIEFGMEYVGDNTIVCHGRGVNNTGVYGSFLYRSTDMGRTWMTSQPVNLQVLGRMRIATRSHVMNTNRWWEDPIIISHGFKQTSPPTGVPRRLCIYVSKDKGLTWTAPLYLKNEGYDGGYGSFLWNPTKGEYVSILYFAPKSYTDGELRQINWKLDWC